MDAYEQDARIFKALCDPRRLAILEQLRSGENVPANCRNPWP